jgi:hypothetical protein
MPEEDHVTPAEEELAAALGRLVPVRPRIDRDRMMFLAGRASARRRLSVWQGATAALVVGLVAAVWLRPTVPQRRGAAPAPARRAAAPAAGPVAGPPLRLVPAAGAGASYARLRNEVLAAGLAALPPMSESRPEDELLTLADARRSATLRPAGQGHMSTVWDLLLSGRAKP